MNPHYISRGKNSGKVSAINFIPNRFSSRFSTSPTNGPRSLLQAKAGTHSALPEKSHTAPYTPKHGASLLPLREAFRFLFHFGQRKAEESGRTPYGVCPLSSVPQPRWAALPRLQFGGATVLSLCVRYFLHVRGKGGITTLGVLYMSSKRPMPACQSG